MRPSPRRLAGLALLIGALAVIPFASHATLVAGFLVLALGLLGIVLLLGAPRAPRREDASDVRDRDDAM